MNRSEPHGDVPPEKEPNLAAQRQGRLSVWLPTDVLDALDAQATAEGQTRRAALIQLISSHGNLREQTPPLIPVEIQVGEARRMRAAGRTMVEICDALGLRPDEAWSIKEIRQLFIHPCASPAVERLAALEVPSQASAPQGEGDAEALPPIRLSPRGCERLEAITTALGDGVTREIALELAVHDLWRNLMDEHLTTESSPPEPAAVPDARKEAVEKKVAKKRIKKTPRRKQAGIEDLAGTPRYRKALAKEARRERKRGATWMQIADRWNEQGLPTLSGVGKWHATTVSRVAASH